MYDKRDNCFTKVSEYEQEMPQSSSVCLCLMFLFGLNWDFSLALTVYELKSIFFVWSQYVSYI